MFRRPAYIDREEAELQEKYDREERDDISLIEFFEQNASKKLKTYYAYEAELHRRARERGVYI